MSSLLVQRLDNTFSHPWTTRLSLLAAAILAIIRPIDAAAALVCNGIDNALEFEYEYEERPALKDLRKGVENLKSSVVAFDVLLSAVRVGAELTMIMYVTWLRSIHMLKELIIHDITEWTKRKQ